MKIFSIFGFNLIYMTILFSYFCNKVFFFPSLKSSVNLEFASYLITYKRSEKVVVWSLLFVNVKKKYSRVKRQSSNLESFAWNQILTCRRKKKYNKRRCQSNKSLSNHKLNWYVEMKSNGMRREKKKAHKVRS